VTTDRRARMPPPVVQFRADGDRQAGPVSARIEHVSSGTVALIDSIDEPIAWIRRVLLLTSSTPSSRGDAMRWMK
jgi:hypothetical protein